MDGWFHFLSSKGLRKSEVTSILLTKPRICLYLNLMYVWSCSFADGYLQQLTIQAIKRSDEDYALTNILLLTLSGMGLTKYADFPCLWSNAYRNMM